MNKKKGNIISAALLLAIFALSVFYIAILNTRTLLNAEVVAEKGVFDFKRNTFEDHKLLVLRGEVEFYWNQLLTPADFQTNNIPHPIDYIYIPEIWNKHLIDGKEINSYGFASYHFKIQLPEDDVYAIKIKEFETAYKIWVNGDLLTETGIVGKTKESMQASWRRKLIFFKTTNKTADVVIQISNFQHRKGGPDTPMVFGKANDVNKYKSALVGIELVLFGVLFILSTYHIVLYFFRPKDKSFLYFSIICFVMLIRLCTTGEKIALDILPDMNWLTTIRLEYLSYQLTVPFFMLFIYQFYKQEFSLTVVKWVNYITVLFCILVLFFPPIIFTHTPIIFQAFIALISLYIFYSLIKAYLHKRENATIFILSFLAFSLIIINDILFYNNLINTGYLLPYGMFIIAYALSIVLSKNVAMAFVNMENLSLQLDQHNKLLEQNVQDRTEQIRIQKEELEQQASTLKKNNEQLKELSAFKESLTEMIIHDLKNPLNIILNFSKDERVVFAGNQMLNLVHNLLDVQRYENSAMKLNLETVSVQELIQQAAFQMNFLTKEKDIHLSIKQSKNYLILVDPEIINRVFVNLLSNALKFTPNKGDVTIFIKEKFNSISICFSDSGPGIPPDQKNVIFEKFGQFIIQRAGRSGSTGLGLTFCKLAIEAHRGSIDFTSILGKGATFCCTLPKQRISNEPVKQIFSATTDSIPIDQMQFSSEEKLILSEIVEKLSNAEIYEIGKIKTLMKNIDENQTDNIKRWITAVQKALLNSDTELFSALLHLIRK
ncbi:MAG: 7TM diverse intracellular signaling domain-containing protein [Prolixibacteraceae bacterium]